VNPVGRDLGRKILWLYLLLLAVAPLSAETWYVRRDGGSRFSAKTRTGQCDGKADAAYRGKGTNQHCAFNDYRYLWDDKSYTVNAWVIAGGDTVILRDGPWRVGFNQGASGGDVWCAHGTGPFDCFNPPIPAGTASQHTRILGENYSNCGSNNKTQIFGGFGVGVALNLGDTQFVDIQCLEITRHSQCTRHGYPVYPSGCSSSFPLDDYDGSGIVTNVSTRDLALTDIWVHGHTDRGIIGAIGGVVTCLRCVISYNGMAGWDFDDGRATPFGAGAQWNFLYSTIEWNGCNQEYPITHTYPAISCYGQSSGGYGDGVGTPAGTGFSANIDHSTFRYNTQDGLDLGHIDTGKHILNITNSTAYGNSGGAFKWGANATAAMFVNNLVLGNCLRMSVPIAGAPETYNTHLSDFCRAEDTLSFNLRQGGTALFENNTIVSYSPTIFDIDCWEDHGCSASTLTLKNNIIFGYENPATFNLGGKPGGPGGLFFQHPIGNVIRSNNLYYGIRGLRCVTLLHGEHCDEPKFQSQPKFSKEQDLDNFNFHLAPGSPAIRSGANLPELKTDHDGNPRPPSGNYNLGALEN
jgi:hypothetical protein